MNNILNKCKRISVELEVEHRKLDRNQLKIIRQKLRDNFTRLFNNKLRIVYDYSLYNGGIELSGPLFPKKKWYPIINYLNKLNFIVNRRTGLHIHFDMKNIIKNINNLNRLARNILKIQKSHPKYFVNHISAYHQLYPVSVLEKLEHAKTIEEFTSILLYELRGGILGSDLIKALSRKQSEHDYWIDLTPILRHLIGYKDPSDAKYKRVIGSIEIRGCFADNMMNDDKITIERFENITQELINLFVLITRNI